MKNPLALAAFAVLTALSALHAAPWKHETLRIQIDFPKGWYQVTAKKADQLIANAKDSAAKSFYRNAKSRLHTGTFMLFEQPAAQAGGKLARADLQSSNLGRAIRPMQEQDIKNLCPLWAQNHGPDERPFVNCAPRRIGNAWTAYLVYEPDDDGKVEYQIKQFRTDGTVILLTVQGTARQAEAIFSNTKFY